MSIAVPILRRTEIVALLALLAAVGRRDTLVLFVEWLYLRTGDELYRTLAKRWAKVMAALFAAGVVTGTILSFEMGLLWPELHRQLRQLASAALWRSVGASAPRSSTS